MAYLTLGKASDIPEGEMRAYDIAGYEIAVARVKGAYFAFDNRCPHRFDYMTNGVLSSERVICAFHGAEFALNTGTVLDGPSFDPLPVFPTRIENDTLQIEWPDEVSDELIKEVDASDEEHRLFTQFLI